MDWGKMTIQEVIEKHPKAIEILQENGIGCLGCLMAHSENLEDGLMAHGADVKAIIDELNATYEG